MLNICDDFATEFDVVFNASKSECLVFKPFADRNWSSTISVLEAKRENLLIAGVTSGHVLNVSKVDGADMNKIWNAMSGHINNVLCYFGHEIEMFSFKDAML